MISDAMVVSIGLNDTFVYHFENVQNQLKCPSNEIPRYQPCREVNCTWWMRYKETLNKIRLILQERQLHVDSLRRKGCSFSNYIFCFSKKQLSNDNSPIYSNYFWMVLYEHLLNSGQSYKCAVLLLCFETGILKNCIFVILIICYRRLSTSLT